MLSTTNSGNSRSTGARRRATGAGVKAAAKVAGNRDAAPTPISKLAEAAGVDVVPAAGTDGAIHLQAVSVDTESAVTFAVRFHYSAEAVRLVARVPGARYLVAHQMWEVPKDQHAALGAVLCDIDRKAASARDRDEAEALRASRRQAALEAVRFLASPADAVRIGSRILVGEDRVVVTSVGPAFRDGVEVSSASGMPGGEGQSRVWAYFRPATADEAADFSGFRPLDHR